MYFELFFEKILLRLYRKSNKYLNYLCCNPWHLQVESCDSGECSVELSMVSMISPRWFFRTLFVKVKTGTQQMTRLTIIYKKYFLPSIYTLI